MTVSIYPGSKSSVFEKTRVRARTVALEFNLNYLHEIWTLVQLSHGYENVASDLI